MCQPTEVQDDSPLVCQPTEVQDPTRNTTNPVASLPAILDCNAPTNTSMITVGDAAVCPLCNILCLKSFLADHVTRCAQSLTQPQIGTGSAKPKTNAKRKREDNAEQSNRKREKKQCDRCKENYTTTITEHRLNCDPIYKCETCPKTFRHIGNYRSHSQACASRPKKNNTLFICSQCGKSVKGKTNFERHVAACNPWVERKCPKCQKRFESDKGFKLHMEKNTCEKNKITCENCNAVFYSDVSYNSHPCFSYKCKTCKKSFQSKRACQRHEQICQNKIYKCSICGAEFHNLAECRAHERVCNNKPAEKPVEEQTYGCTQCSARFSTRHELYRHSNTVHPQVGSGELQSTPWKGDENSPWVNADGTIDDELRDAYQADIRHILAPSRHGDRDRPRVYNLPINHNVQMSDIIPFLREIQQNENHSFRINLEFGYILRDRISGRHRYYRPISGNGVLRHPFRIDNASDIDRLEKLLRRMEFIQQTLNKRPNTKWELALLTNLQATVYPMDFVAGSYVTLPTYIKNSKSIISLEVSKEGVPYDDHLCAFRCLAHFLGTPSETEVNKLWRQYLSHKKIKETDFKGMPLADMAIFEECFEINTTIYSLFEDGTVEPIYKSPMRHQRTMYLNLYDTHLSLITRIASYSRKFKCTYCGHLWKTSRNLHVHQRSCMSKTKYRFPDFLEAITRRTRPFSTKSNPSE